MSSGAATSSSRSRARAVSPSAPSSPSAVARTLASTTSTVVANCSRRGFERHRTARASTGAVEHFWQGRVPRFVDESPAEVFLQRLVSFSRTAPQDGVNIVGYILDLHARHGAILALMAPKCNRAPAVTPPNARPL